MHGRVHITGSNFSLILLKVYSPTFPEPLTYQKAEINQRRVAGSDDGKVLVSVIERCLGDKPVNGQGVGKLVMDHGHL